MVLLFQEAYSTRLPFVTCMSRRAQFGTRTSLGRPVWFTESHLVLVIFFLPKFYLFILLLIQNNVTLYPVQQLDHF